MPRGRSLSPALTRAKAEGNGRPLGTGKMARSMHPTRTGHGAERHAERLLAHDLPSRPSRPIGAPGAMARRGTRASRQTTPITRAGKPGPPAPRPSRDPHRDPRGVVVSGSSSVADRPYGVRRSLRRRRAPTARSRGLSSRRAKSRRRRGCFRGARSRAFRARAPRIGYDLARRAKRGSPAGQSHHRKPPIRGPPPIGPTVAPSSYHLSYGRIVNWRMALVSRRQEVRAPP
jgi:hypothetical protein